jgi:oligogalacturonide lyase
VSGRTRREALGLALAAGSSALLSGAARAEAARSWIDPLTGHRVVRISRVADTYNLYFNKNGYSPQGDKLAVNTPGGMAVVDLRSWEVRPLATPPGSVLLFAGRRTRSLYFASRARQDDGGPFTVFAADIDSGRVRKVADVPGGWIGSINADETLLAGQFARGLHKLRPDGTLARPGEPPSKPGQNDYSGTWPDGRPMTYAEAKLARLNERLDARVPMELFTIDLRTGARRVVLETTDWLNHIQFSPTEPGQLMYCHEGPWTRVDRIWTIRTDGSAKRLVHPRTMAREGVGHEYWSADGKWIWYDLQRPEGEVFWVAGYELATGRRRWFHVERDQWSVHYNLSPDGRRFLGEGSDPEMAARASDAKYLTLLTPEPIADVAGIHAPGSESLVAPGLLRAEKLVDLRRQDYRLEPNAGFTPDGKWIVFRGNFEGATHLYAVEVAK